MNKFIFLKSGDQTKFLTMEELWDKLEEEKRMSRVKISTKLGRLRRQLKMELLEMRLV